MSYILILGSNSEVGRAVSRKYAQNGYNLYLAEKETEEAKNEAKNLEIKYGIKARIVKFDILEFYNHKNFYSALNPRPVGVICLINYTGEQYKAEADFLETKKIIDTNFTGCVSILTIIANDFEARKEGFIVGVSSMAGDRGRKSNYIFGSAKAGFTTFLSGLRSRLLKADVQVTTIKTGIIATKDIENMDLPMFITVKPEEAANDIFKAQQKNRDIVYSKWQCRIIAMFFNHIPEILFKRMDT